MAAAGQGDTEAASVGVGGEQSEDDRAEPRVVAVVFVVENRVEVAQDGGRVGVVDGGGAQGVAGQGGDGRCGCALAAHVTQEQSPRPGGEREQVVEVAADLVGGGDVVVRGYIQAGHVHQGRGQEGLLQGGVEALELFAFAFCFLPGAQQLGFVGAAVAGVEDGGADQQWLPVAAGLDRGGHQYRQTAAVGRLEFQSDSADLSLHAQQRSEVRLVVEPASHGEQIGERLVADQVATSVAQPVEQRSVDLRDRAVQQGGEIAARRTLVQVFRAVFQQGGERRVVVTALAALAVTGLAHHRLALAKAVIAAAVSSGAASWGQCPVAFSVTRWLPGICACTKGPTSGGAIASLEHCATKVGTVTLARSSRLSDRNVTRAKARAMSGSVRQKLLVSSSPRGTMPATRASWWPGRCVRRGSPRTCAHRPLNRLACGCRSARRCGGAGPRRATGPGCGSGTS